MKSPLAKRLIRVLVVDDSIVARELLVYLLNGDPQLLVVGVAADGQQAVESAARLLPDVITMDIHLPRMDGFAATRKIMETCPTRIVMVTASSVPHEVAESFRALESGALTVLAKPLGPGHPNHQAAAAELIQAVKLMAEVKVVRRWARLRTTAAPPLKRSEAATMTDIGNIRMVAIGASTGGPIALQAILSRLAPDFAVPILIVQHISPGFAGGFIEWLARASAFRVKAAVHGECALPGVAYVAPDGVHMTILANGSIALSEHAPEYGLRPSVSSLFRSVASAFGAHAVGVLLTGMGRDGAQELKLLQDGGAVTIAQDKESSVIFGMPGEAVKLDAAKYVLPPEGIALALNRLTQKR